MRACVYCVLYALCFMLCALCFVLCAVCCVLCAVCCVLCGQYYSRSLEADPTNADALGNYANLAAEQLGDNNKWGTAAHTRTHN